jgi:two-component system, NarL family, response regulator YdfI
MIRVGIASSERIPDSLISHIKTSADVEIVERDFDVLLIYTKIWNRSESLKIDRNSKLPIIICDSYEDPFATDSLLRQQVAGILLIETSTQQLRAALQAAAAGLKFLQPLKKRAINLLQAETLTQRELEILRLIADGEGNKSIANLLNISQHTVKFHISSIFEKLNVSSRTEAIKAGISRGLISI